MKSIFFLSRFRQWLKSAEFFLLPSQKIIGRWLLFEYYTEPGDELINIKEDKLIENNRFLMIEFTDQDLFIQNSNLEVRFFEDTVSCNWSISGNFLRLSDPAIPAKAEEFHFAVEKGILKLLKKDVSGRIIFFGFFKKHQELQG